MFVRLKDFREDNKLHQSELAQLFNVAQSTLSRWELINKELSDHHFKALAEKYGMSLVSKYVDEKKSTVTADTKSLNIILCQQEEITRLHKRIDTLTDLLTKLLQNKVKDL